MLFSLGVWQVVLLVIRAAGAKGRFTLSPEGEGEQQPKRGMDPSDTQKLLHDAVDKLQVFASEVHTSHPKQPTSHTYL